MGSVTMKHGMNIHTFSSSSSVLIEFVPLKSRRTTLNITTLHKTVCNEVNSDLSFNSMSGFENSLCLGRQTDMHTYILF